MQAWRTDGLSRIGGGKIYETVTCLACGGITTSIHLPARCWALRPRLARGAEPGRNQFTVRAQVP